MHVRSDLCVVIDVDLGDPQLAGEFLRQFLENRRDRLARAAPRRPKSTSTGVVALAMVV